MAPLVTHSQDIWSHGLCGDSLPPPLQVFPFSLVSGCFLINSPKIPGLNIAALHIAYTSTGWLGLTDGGMLAKLKREGRHRGPSTHPLSLARNVREGSRHPLGQKRP
jgi:hypothetical protein